ncbi:hypothetical protein ES703_113753 [subsurface metagenome]
MADKKLRPKYQVQKIVGDKPMEVYGLEGPKMLSTDPDNADSPFVLMPRKDPAAFAAVVAYARHCEPGLAKEIKEWLQKITGAPVAFGTQGQRNFRHARLKMTGDILV